MSPSEKLMLVIILGIVAGLLFTQVNDYRARHRDNQRRTDINFIQHQVESFFALNGVYPMTLAEAPDLPAQYCQDPRGHGNCSKPDYTYKVFASGSAVSPTSTSNCDNKKSGNECAAYVIYTQKMERSPNPFLVSNY